MAAAYVVSKDFLTACGSVLVGTVSLVSSRRVSSCVVLLGPFGGRSGTSFGSLGGLLGTSWGPLGSSWGSLGGVLGRLGSNFSDLGALLGSLGVLLGSLGGLLGASWEHFEGIFEASKTKKTSHLARNPPSLQSSRGGMRGAIEFVMRFFIDLGSQNGPQIDQKSSTNLTFSSIGAGSVFCRSQVAS